jgi:hypothetical protein
VSRRILFALFAAALAWVVVASNLPAADTGAADWTRPRVARTSGIAVLYPRAWHASMDGNTLLIWSGGDPKHRSAELANNIPAGAVWIWLLSYGHLPRTSGFMRRPVRFELRDEDRAFQSCGFGFEGWNLTFVEHGQVVQAIVGLGRGARKSDALGVLDRLRVAG